MSVALLAYAALLAAGGIQTFGSVIGFILAILVGYACSSIAKSKGRGGTLWFILGFFFTLIAVIVIALLPSKRR
jgi:multisubunit Na+/H+ antiporter MnhE subunit